MLLIALGCTTSACKREDHQPAEVAASCYSKLERPSAGQLRLSGPLSCDEAAPRFRTQGPPDKPDLVEFINADGRLGMTYKVGYNAQGRPMSEERIIRLGASHIKVYSRGDRKDFVKPAGSGSQTVRIKTKLDQTGRAVEVSKYAGSELAYRMRRVYGPGGLESEATYDGAGKLKFRSEFYSKDGKRMERMFDGSGKQLLQRELKSFDMSSRSPVKGR